ncbi:hypothetical protein ACIG56_30870 [Nocardia fusca]|uniref:hypothetical protein n=1 Tax=Nocardia fusca TaxID=941183 RepID=UPI0037C65D78
MTRNIADSAFVVVRNSPPQSVRTTGPGMFVTTGLPDAVTGDRERLDIDRDAPDLRRLPVIR